MLFGYFYQSRIDGRLTQWTSLTPSRWKSDDKTAMLQPEMIPSLPVTTEPVDEEVSSAIHSIKEGVFFYSAL